MPRLEQLKAKIDQLYQAKSDGRANWSDWLYANHIFIVAEYAGDLADRFGANKELAVAAALLHDVADAVMSRFDPRHEEETVKIAKLFLRDSGFSDEESKVIVDDAIKFHSCRDGKYPKTLEGKVMATADALVHLKTDFYKRGVQTKREEGESDERIRSWALPKIERDFHDKILFDEVRDEVKTDYERLKATLF